MSKKYVPSGYQIIDLDIKGKSQNDTWLPRNEDEKILLDYVKNDVPKPLLIRIHYGNGEGFIKGFAFVSNTYIGIGTTDNSDYGVYIQLSITNDDKIELTQFLEP